MYDLILRNFAMHILIHEDEQRHVLAGLQHRNVKKNEVLLQADEICRNVYFVNQGCLRLFHTDREGQDHNILFCPEGWWAADMASFSAQKPAFFSISALEDTEVLYFNFNVLERLYLEIPKLERFFRILSQNGFSLFQRRLTSSHSQTAEERYARFQRLYPALERRIAQKHIASYLGITPVFLSVIRNK